MSAENKAYFEEEEYFDPTGTMKIVETSVDAFTSIFMRIRNTTLWVRD